MKKIICIKDVTRLNCKNGDIFDLIREGDEYWDISINGKVHRIANFFKEFMPLNEQRKLKIKKLNAL